MGFGIHLRELWRLRAGLVVSLVLASLAAVWSVAHISLLPPRLTPRALEMATAHTQLVIDTPNSALTDLRLGTTDMEALKNRAVLVGNVMASPPVRLYIARRADVRPETLQILTPRTPKAPRAAAGKTGKKGPGDLFESTDQYRLDIQANPTVPVLDVYAQAPTAAAAANVANAAVDGLRDYIERLDAERPGRTASQIRVRQLGRADGEVLNAGIEPQVAGLAFLLMFALSCAATLGLSRVRRGWAVARAAEF